MSRWFYSLLVFAALAAVLAFLHIAIPPLLLFVIAGLGILPLAALIGQSVEQVAEHTGGCIGGLLFATFGNATELIIGLFALSEGLVDVVRASIIGSILGNVLLVLGSRPAWEASSMVVCASRCARLASTPPCWRSAWVDCFCPPSPNSWLRVPASRRSSSAASGSPTLSRCCSCWAISSQLPHRFNSSLFG